MNNELYNRDEVVKETAQAGTMFTRELPKIFCCLLFFYGMLGLGIPWRAEAPHEMVWNSVKASLIFCAVSGGVVLIVGSFFMSSYALRKAPYTDFRRASSLTMMWSYRVFGVLGIPAALWDVFRVVLPLLGVAGEKIAHEWWISLLFVSGWCGWFSGLAVGGLIGLLAVWMSGRRLLKRL